MRTAHKAYALELAELARFMVFAKFWNFTNIWHANYLLDQEGGEFTALRACHRPLDRTFARGFSKFFRRAGLDPREKINSGRRDLSVVKVSASYDPWRPKKWRKTEKQKFEEKLKSWKVFCDFGKVFEDLRSNGPQNQIQRQILLQVQISWGLCDQNHASK